MCATVNVRNIHPTVRTNEPCCVSVMSTPFLRRMMRLLWASASSTTRASSLYFFAHFVDDADGRMSRKATNLPSALETILCLMTMISPDFNFQAMPPKCADQRLGDRIAGMNFICETNGNDQTRRFSRKKTLFAGGLRQIFEIPLLNQLLAAGFAGRGR